MYNYVIKEKIIVLNRIDNKTDLVFITTEVKHHQIIMINLHITFIVAVRRGLLMPIPCSRCGNRGENFWNVRNIGEMKRCILDIERHRRRIFSKISSANGLGVL